MVIDMKRAKKRISILAAIIFVAVVVFSVFYCSKQYSHAADEIFITYKGQRLNPEEILQMTSGNLPLMLETTGTAYDEDDYVVEWSFSVLTIRW